MPEIKNEAADPAYVENKLLLLYLIDKMDIPLSNSQISQFTLEAEYMDYFTLQMTLSEMVEAGYLEKTQDNNNTRYTITEEGATTLEYFERHIQAPIRLHINKYVTENRKSVKRDYEVTASYFFENENNDYIVKCGIYDDRTVLMEINLAVDARDQAKIICGNWKENVNKLYGRILTELITNKKDEEEVNENK